MYDTKSVFIKIITPLSFSPVYISIVLYKSVRRHDLSRHDLFSLCNLVLNIFLCPVIRDSNILYNI